MTATNKSYDFAYTRERPHQGRFHHVTYALDSREDMLRAADIFLEAGVFIETGPHKHAIQHLLPLRLRARRQPGGGRLRRRAAGAGAGLEADPLVGSRAQEGQPGPADFNRSIPRHAAGAGRAGVVRGPRSFA